MTKNTMNFEEANKELDKIIYRLENENLTLDESINLFKRADELLKICEENFKSAEGEITVIKNNIEKSLKSFE